jgi:type I restriction enzyme S subunit
MRPRNGASEFVYCLARTDEFREHAIKSMVGSSGRQRVQASALTEFELLKPSGTIIDQFTALTRPMFRQIRVLREQNIRLQKARDLLLPRLMRGELKP